MAARPLFGQRRSAVRAIVGVELYTLPVSAGASVVRAGGHNDGANLAALNPRLALISVAAGNPEGNPAPVVFARLAGRDALRTDRHGAVTVETDGGQMWIEVQR